jgi:hypothetical protein
MYPTMIGQKIMHSAATQRPARLLFSWVRLLECAANLLNPSVFLGVAVYYLSPLWPYDVSTLLSLDGGQSVLVSLRGPDFSLSGDSQTSQSSVAWSATGLTNTSHTLTGTWSLWMPSCASAFHAPGAT